MLRKSRCGLERRGVSRKHSKVVRWDGRAGCGARTNIRPDQAGRLRGAHQALVKTCAVPKSDAVLAIGACGMVFSTGPAADCHPRCTEDADCCPRGATVGSYCDTAGSARAPLPTCEYIESGPGARLSSAAASTSIVCIPGESPCEASPGAHGFPTRCARDLPLAAICGTPIDGCCGPGSYCSTASVFAEGTCLVQRPAGAPCDALRPDECASQRCECDVTASSCSYTCRAPDAGAPIPGAPIVVANPVTCGSAAGSYSSSLLR